MRDAAPDRAPAPANSDIAEQLGIRPAPVPARATAFLIDVLAWSALISPAGVGLWLALTVGPGFWAVALIAAGAALSALFCLVQLILHGRRGVTLGKAAMRLRSVSLPGLAQPGFWRIVLRALVLSVSQVVPVVGPLLLFLSGYWDPTGRGRSLLDRVGACWLIDVRGGLDPTDANALRRARRGYEAQFRDISEHLPVLSTHGVGSRLELAPQRRAAAVVGASAENRGAPSRDPLVDRSAPGTAQRPAAGAPQAAGPAGDGAAAADAPAHRVDGPDGWHLVFDDGSTVEVTGAMLIGRSPVRGGRHRARQLIALDDPQRMMSKTHLALGTDEAGVWIEDLGSSNGTSVRPAGQGEPRPIAGNTPVRLAHGAVVQIGGRVFRVQREDGLR